MTGNSVVLDTNVLEHLLRTEPGGENSDGHIGKLLGKITLQGRTICFDSGGRMEGELQHRLELNKSHPEMKGNLHHLRAVLITLPKQRLDVDYGDGLMNCIDACVRQSGAEQSDKVFIYVACQADTVLISNNRCHITDHANCLKGCANSHMGTTPEFWDSQTANANL